MSDTADWLPQVASESNPLVYKGGSPQAPAQDDPGGDLLAGALSSGNSALFGIPKALIEGLGGESGAKQKIADYISKHKEAWQVGDIAGTVAGAFIPVVGTAGKGLSLAGRIAGETGLAGRALGGLGRGLQAAEAAGSAKNIAKLAGRGIKASPDVFARLGTKGFLDAAAQEALRNASGQDSGGVGQIGFAGATGGALGAIGGRIGRSLSKAPRILEDMANQADTTAVSNLMGVNKKDFNLAVRGAQKYSMGKVGVSEPQVEGITARMAGRLRELDDPGKMAVKGLLEDGISPVWASMDASFKAERKSLFDFVHPHYGPTGQILDIGGEVGKLPEVKAYLDYMEKTASRNVGLQQLSAMIKASNAPADLAGTQSHLLDWGFRSYNAAKNGGADAAQAIANQHLGDAAFSIKNLLQEHALKYVPPELVQRLHLGSAEDLRALFRDTRAFEFALARQAKPGTLSMGTGSQTAPRMIFQAMVGGSMGGNPIGALLTMLGADIAHKGVVKVANRALGQGALKAAPLLREAIPAGEALTAGPLPGVAAGLGSTAASVIPALANQAQRAEWMSEAPASGQFYGADVANPRAFHERLDAGIRQKFLQSFPYPQIFGPAQDGNPTYDQFKAGVYQALTNNGQTGIDVRKAGRVMFFDPEDIKSYEKAIDAQKQMREAVPGAAKTFGSGYLGNLTNQSALTSRGSLASVIKDITGDPKIAGNIMNNPLTSNAQKLRLIQEVFRKYNVGGSNALKLAGVQ